jgi:hypothetical protein
MARQPLVDQGLLIVEVLRSNSDPLHSVGLLWTSNKPDAETSTWQHTTHTRDRHPCPRRNSNSRSQQTIGRRPRSHQNQLLKHNNPSKFCCSSLHHLFDIYTFYILLREDINRYFQNTCKVWRLKTISETVESEIILRDKILSTGGLIQRVKDGSVWRQSCPVPPCSPQITRQLAWSRNQSCEVWRGEQ